MKATCQITKQPLNPQSILTSLCQDRASTFCSVWPVDDFLINAQNSLPSQIFTQGFYSRPCKFTIENKFMVEKNLEKWRHVFFPILNYHIAWEFALLQVINWISVMLLYKFTIVSYKRTTKASSGEKEYWRATSTTSTNSLYYLIVTQELPSCL